MIYESWVWKERLQEELTAFKSIMDTIFRKPADLSDEELDMHITRINSKIEQFIFLSAFMIRKLYEANKVSGELKSSNYPCIQYPRLEADVKVDYWNKHKIDRFYDLKNENKSSLSIESFFNICIHSFIFEGVRDDNDVGWIGILANSDRYTHKCLFFIGKDEIIKMINDVIEDEVVGIISLRHEGKIYTTRYQGEKGQKSLNRQMGLREEKRGKTKQ